MKRERDKKADRLSTRLLVQPCQNFIRPSALSFGCVVDLDENLVVDHLLILVLELAYHVHALNDGIDKYGHDRHDRVLEWKDGRAPDGALIDEGRDEKHDRLFLAFSGGVRILELFDRLKDSLDESEQHGDDRVPLCD